MRGQGRVFKPRVRGGYSDVWWIDYGLDGERFRESTHSTSKRAAFDLLRQRIGDRKSGKLTATSPDKVMLAEYAKGPDGTRTLVGGLRALHEERYKNDGRRSGDRLADAYNHLEAFFGSAARASSLTAVRCSAYTAHRLKAGAARATVRYELAALRRAFRLAVAQGVLAVMPVITMPEVSNARSGFFTERDFIALMAELRDPLLRAYLRLKRVTGWRDNELKPLLWASVDLEAQEIRLAPTDTKGAMAFRFPYANVPDVAALIVERWADRLGPYVFQRKGKPIRDYRTAWKNACRRAGLARTMRDPETGKLREVLPIPHDFRRSAARDWRPYLSEKEIMALVGWKSRSTFERYNIVNPDDVTAGIDRRYGQQTANTPPAETATRELS